MIRLEDSPKRDLWQVISLFVLVVILLVGIYTSEKALGMGDISQIVVQEILLFIIFFGLNYFWTKQPVKLGLTVSFRKLIPISLPIIVLVLWILFIMLGKHSAHTMILATVSGLGAGIFEEYLFRGIILAKLLKVFSGSSKAKTVAYAVIVSSLLFGCTHATNFAAQSIPETLLQILNAAFMGAILAALYLRSGSIIVPMLFHGLWDFNTFVVTGSTVLKSGSTSIAPMIGSWVVFLLIALYYFRRSKIQEIDLKHFE
ncbi:lysostaphin resistance A-like protein [Lentilactobacillus otakiensis]|uniref:CPBP family intramembrane glutamic endopeptidase n=1 Tax=Lentilactobacillus otakiensis TaxID=481720 RepID=UPI003D17AB08